LKCYSCKDIDSAERCNTTIECPGTDYQCITGVSFTNDFRQVFKLGCAPNSVCSHYGKRSISRRADASCCSSDLCNHNGHIKRSIDAPVFIKDSRRETAPSMCDDTDELACTLLFTTNPHFCADDCFADKICPRLCGRCSECYSCDHVNETEQCNQTRVCEKGENCNSPS
ncbi:uncharacterized protein LOC134281628, partial [Saccostrea cucullata]|uniref:uncharacterized protein LOC134281628 n=1 Tax=Saccostrea cuccullata TaxID=36930 RepID=UPI002ED2442A